MKKIKSLNIWGWVVLEFECGNMWWPAISFILLLYLSITMIFVISMFRFQSLFSAIHKENTFSKWPF
jgi:membrane protein YdbS with pleckstrin-like domain